MTNLYCDNDANFDANGNWNCKTIMPKTWTTTTIICTFRRKSVRQLTQPVHSVVVSRSSVGFSNSFPINNDDDDDGNYDVDIDDDDIPEDAESW